MESIQSGDEERVRSVMHHFAFTKLKEFRFLQLSLLIIAFMFVSPFLERNWFFQILLQLFMLNSVLVTLSAAGKGVRIRRTLWILWAVAAIASLVSYIPTISSFHTVALYLELGCLTLLLLGCVVGILAFVFHNLRTTLDGIFAALTAYLLLAYAFAMIFVLVFQWNPESFQIPAPATGSPSETIRTEMMYFSFVTIATLGYGDIVPVTPFPRMLAVVEAVMGQFYVAVVIALLVGSLIAHSPPPGDPDG